MKRKSQAKYFVQDNKKEIIDKGETGEEFFLSVNQNMFGFNIPTNQCLYVSLTVV